MKYCGYSVTVYPHIPHSHLPDLVVTLPFLLKGISVTFLSMISTYTSFKASAQTLDAASRSLQHYPVVDLIQFILLAHYLYIQT